MAPSFLATPLTALPPLLSPNTRLLVLGSFPGVASLQSRQYYGHPRNHFWPIIEAILARSAAELGTYSYEKRSKWLLDKKVGVWDVYAACERQGSLDSDIRNAVLNDFSKLKMQCPDLQAVVHNGAESFRHSKYVMASLCGTATKAQPDDLSPDLTSVQVQQVQQVQFHRLPSTSPAHAAWSFERKLVAWRDVFEKYGLV